MIPPSPSPSILDDPPLEDPSSEFPSSSDPISQIPTLDDNIMLFQTPPRNVTSQSSLPPPSPSYVTDLSSWSLDELDPFSIVPARTILPTPLTPSSEAPTNNTPPSTSWPPSDSPIIQDWPDLSPLMETSTPVPVSTTEISKPQPLPSTHLVDVPPLTPLIFSTPTTSIKTLSYGSRDARKCCAKCSSLFFPVDFAIYQHLCLTCEPNYPKTSRFPDPPSDYVSKYPLGKPPGADSPLPLRKNWKKNKNADWAGMEMEVDNAPSPSPQAQSLSASSLTPVRPTFKAAPQIHTLVPLSRTFSQVVRGPVTIPAPKFSRPTSLPLAKSTPQPDSYSPTSTNTSSGSYCSTPEENSSPWTLVSHKKPIKPKRIIPSLMSIAPIPKNLSKESVEKVLNPPCPMLPP